MSVELGSVLGDKRKEILERQAVSELEQEKALHQLAVERANRACERADAAEAERDALRETLAQVKALADKWSAYHRMSHFEFGECSEGPEYRADMGRTLCDVLAQNTTDKEGWLTQEAKRARERAASVPPHARPTTGQPAVNEKRDAAEKAEAETERQMWHRLRGGWA